MSTNINEQDMIRSKNYYPDLSICPKCKGDGLIRVWISTPYTVETYGDDRKIEYFEDCPYCKGGKAEKVQSAKKSAGIPFVYTNDKYDSFNWYIYKDHEGKNIDTSKHKKVIESFLRDFNKWDSKGFGLYIYSKTRGSGKTFLASCICNELMERYAIRPKFVRASDLLDIAKSGDSNSPDEYKREPLKLLYNCKLLVIDDIGQKNTGNGWMEDIVFNIMDKRVTQGLTTIITSNMSIPDLPFDDRIVDRINGSMFEMHLPEFCVRSKDASLKKRQLLEELGLK